VHNYADVDGSSNPDNYADITELNEANADYIDTSPTPREEDYDTARQEVREQDYDIARRSVQYGQADGGLVEANPNYHEVSAETMAEANPDYAEYNVADVLEERLYDAATVGTDGDCASSSYLLSLSLSFRRSGASFLF
jgi:hypothetical protein